MLKDLNIANVQKMIRATVIEILIVIAKSPVVLINNFENADILALPIGEMPIMAMKTCYYFERHNRNTKCTTIIQTNSWLS